MQTLRKGDSVSLFKPVKIAKIIKFSFFYTVGYAMNASERFELKYENEEYIAQVKLYGIAEEDAIKYKVPENFEQELEKLLKEYSVNKWDGFKKSDKRVLDGNSFDLYVKMEEDNRIDASGYMVWPNNYKEFKEKVVELFKEHMV